MGAASPQSGQQPWVLATIDQEARQGCNRDETVFSTTRASSEKPPAECLGGLKTKAMNDPCGGLVVKLGKAQVDAMFDRQDKGPAIDDSEVLPLVEAVLTAFETTGLDGEVVGELWE